MGIKTEVKIDVSQLGLTLSPGTSYRIEVEEGFTKEDGGEEQPSPANTNLYSFTTNATGPVAQSGSSTVPNMKIKFDRKIFKNTGTIRLYKNGSTLVHTFDINDPTVTITYATGSATTANDALNVNLTGYITDGSTTYHLLADAGVVKDGDNFPSLAITSSSLADYSTGPAPLISTVYPTYNTVNFEDNTKVQLNFNSSILAGAADGSKLIRLYQSPSNTLVHAFDPDGSEVTISGSSAVIKTTGYLKANTEYYMTIDAGAFKTVGGIWLNAVGQGTIKFTTANATFPDLSAGLQSAFSATAEGRILPLSDYYLTTPDATVYVEDTVNAIIGTPQVTEYAYTGSANYSITVTPSPTSAVTTLSSTGTGGSRSFNSSTKVLTLTGNKTAVNSQLAGLTVKPAVDYVGNITLNYHAVSPTGTITDKSQALTIGTPLDTEVTNIINFDRTYIANQTNNIFQSNTPYISDFDTTVGNTYQITLSCAIGKFSALSNYSDASDAWTFTGTMSQVNAKLASMKFMPNKDISSNSTFTYIQKKKNVIQVAVNVNLIGSAAIPSSRTVVFDTVGSHTFQATYDESLYFNADILVVGGGGGATYNGGAGGGGGAGLLTSQSLTTASYPIVVGAGGSAGTIIPNTGENPSSHHASAGTNSSAFSVTAAGGGGGRYYTYLENYPPAYPSSPYVTTYDKDGGASGAVSGAVTVQSYLGGDNSNIVTAQVNPQYGGGGGGATGIGGAGTTNTGGARGNGLTSSITGSSVNYGRGGRGYPAANDTLQSPGGGGTAGENIGATIVSQAQAGATGIVVIKIKNT